MTFFAAISQLFNPATPDLKALATGLCVLPMPRMTPTAPPKSKPTDLFVIDQDRNEYGFHQATANRQTDGSKPELTGYDIRLLKERGYWGKGRMVQERNAKAKAAWHSGRTEKEASVTIGVSESWVEKRFGTFGSALLEEQIER